MQPAPTAPPHGGSSTGPLARRDASALRGRPSRRKSRGDGRAAAAFLGPTLGGFALFTLVPIVGSLVVALTVWPLGGSPAFAGLANFVDLFRDRTFLTSVVVTLTFVVAYVPLNLALSLGVAAWISPRIKGGNFYRLFFFIPVVTPMVANAAVWQLLLIPGGAVDSLSVALLGAHAPNFLGQSSTALATVVLMSLWQGFGYNLLIFTTALRGVPDSVLDAAMIDGAGTVRRFFSIKLPMISPSIFFATTMTLITSFQVFAQPYILTAGGPDSATTTMVMYLYRQGFQYFNLGYASAIGVVLFAMILAVSGVVFLLQKRWVHYD